MIFLPAALSMASHDFFNMAVSISFRFTSSIRSSLFWSTCAVYSRAAIENVVFQKYNSVPARCAVSCQVLRLSVSRKSMIIPSNTTEPDQGPGDARVIDF
jgi:hypothetical protein